MSELRLDSLPLVSYLGLIPLVPLLGILVYATFLALSDVPWKRVICKPFGHIWLRPIHMDDRLEGPAFYVCKFCHHR